MVEEEILNSKSGFSLVVEGEFRDRLGDVGSQGEPA